MTVRLQIILIIVILVSMAVLAGGIYTKRIDLRYALSWIVLGTVFLILAIFPSITEWLTRIMGISLPINMLFLVGIGFIIFIIIGLTSTVSKLTDRQKGMAQHMAILEKELEELREKVKEQEES